MNLYLISYDVATSSPAGQKRLRRVARLCENYGVRVPNSVFECIMDYSTFLSLKHQLECVIDNQTDSLRFTPWVKVEEIKLSI